MGSKKPRNYDRNREKEYSKSYLNYKKEKFEKPNKYPKTRLILIKDFFKSPDLYKAIFLFLSSQVAIISIATSQRYEKMAGAMNLFAIIIGIIVVTISIKEINKRQALDDTRRRFRFKYVMQTIIMMLVAIYTATFIFQLIGVKMPPQPNQESLNTLVTDFPTAMLFTMIIVAPIVEELVFRELLPYATGPSYLSFVISSVMFIALHAPFGLLGWVNYGILSFAFLYARLRNNNIYTGIVAHIIWNAISIIM